GKIGENIVPCLVVLEIWIGDREEAAGWFLVLQICRVEGDKVGWVLCRKRMRQQTVYYGENGGAGADTQGKRQNGEEGKGRRSDHAAQPVLQIAEKIREQIAPARRYQRAGSLIWSVRGPADLLVPIRHCSSSMIRLMALTNPFDL